MPIAFLFADALCKVSLFKDWATFCTGTMSGINMGSYTITKP